MSAADVTTSVSLAQQPQSGSPVSGDFIVGGKGQTASMVPWIVGGTVLIVAAVLALLFFRGGGK